MHLGGERMHVSLCPGLYVLLWETPAVAMHVCSRAGPKAWDTRAFTAARNSGAFCNGEPITVSRNAKLEDALLVTGFGCVPPPERLSCG